MGLESIQGPQSPSGKISFNTLDRFRASYPAHCGPPDYRLYPPGSCSRVGNLVAFTLGTYTGDCGGIPRYLGPTTGHTLQSIPGGCFCIRVALAPVSFSSVGWCNCSSK
jgi:hypothetical protein